MRLATKRCLQSIKQVESLFAQRRKIATNAAKAHGPLLTAKGARHFLLDFEHADIAFGQIVVKGDLQIQQESQHLRFAGQQAIQVDCVPDFVWAVHVCLEGDRICG